MRKPACYTQQQLTVIRPIVTEIGEVFRGSPHDKVNFTIILKQLGKETGMDSRRSFRMVRYFLNREGKKYESKNSGATGARYHISVTREEYERWKKIADLL